jgi:exopolysaccharide biosynthesis polyprenyl glycosylphosphotransferase
MAIEATSRTGTAQRSAPGVGTAAFPAPGPRPAARPARTDRVMRLPRPDVLDDDPRGLLERYRRRAMTSDATSSGIAVLLAFLFRFHLNGPWLYIALSMAIPAVWIGIVAAQRGYEARFLGTGPEEYRRVVASGLILFTVLAVTSFLLRGGFSRAYVLITVPLTVLLSLAGRHFLRHWVYRLRVTGRGLQKVLVVGRADATVAMIEMLDHEPQHGLVAVGACVPMVGPQVSHVHGVPVVGDPDRILEAVDELKVHVVAVVSHPDLSGQSLRRLSWALEERGVELVVSPGIIEVAGPRLSIRPVAQLSLLHLEQPTMRGGRMILKTAFDRIGGSLLLLLAAPVMLALALAIRLTSSGPILFRQTRIGVDGRQFQMLKFRSMVVGAEQLKPALVPYSEGNGMLFKMRRDPRVTRVGQVLRRFSLDELPQLLNVVRGDMSLVGPRPPLPEEVAVYSDDANRRLRVRPGLTGLWQISGRSDLSWEESLRLDLRYVDNWSLALDLSILWRTTRAVLKGAGAY